MKPKIICKEGEGRTKQSMQEECDINKIMKRFTRTGRLPEMIRKNPVYGDFSSDLDYQESLNIINKANLQFEALPSNVRKRFDNDPKKLLAFVHDPKNIEEMYDLGLAIRPKPPMEPKKTEPANEPAQ